MMHFYSQSVVGCFTAQRASRQSSAAQLTTLISVICILSAVVIVDNAPLKENKDQWKLHGHRCCTPRFRFLAEIPSPDPPVNHFLLALFPRLTDEQPRLLSRRFRYRPDTGNPPPPPHLCLLLLPHRPSSFSSSSASNPSSFVSCHVIIYE